MGVQTFQMFPLAFQLIWYKEEEQKRWVGEIIPQTQDRFHSLNEIKMQKERSEISEFLTLLHALELLTGAVTVKKKNNHTREYCDTHCYGSFLHFKPFSQTNSSISPKW